MEYWRPSTTVAAIVERDGRYLVVREQTRDGLKINQPAGHLDPGESLEQAVERETLEEAAYHVAPTALVGVYMSRYRSEATGADVTYVRFAFACRMVLHDPERSLDHGIVEALWLTPDEIRARRDEHRSPLVLQSFQDYWDGHIYPLSTVYTHDSCLYSRV